MFNMSRSAPTRDAARPGRLRGLSRQLVLSLTALVVGMTVFIHVSSFVFYTLMLRDHPEALSDPDTWMPSTAEWLWMGAMLVIGPCVAAVTAGHVARHILAPLGSLADSVRHLSRGDLQARASAGDSAIGEVAELVRDFNLMAERIERTSNELVIWNASIAHELRTPVTILRGRLQGLAEGVFKPDAALFTGLPQQVEGLSRLIDDLRVLSLADGGRLILQRERVDLAPMLGSLLKLLEPELAAGGFSLVARLSAEPVTCDAARVQQMLLALLDNVRQHAQPGPVHVDTMRRGDQFSLCVEDSGPGLSDELAARVFDAFFRGEGARRAPAGSGLGLAVVRAIAQAHGGVASCRRGRAGGALFEVVLPADAAPDL